MSVFMVMYVCGCVLGVQLGGRCYCWHGQWMYLVRVTGSVVGLAVFLVCAFHRIVRNLSYHMYVSILYVMLFYV